MFFVILWLKIKQMNIFKSLEEHPKNIHFESQEPGEQVHFLLRRHPITNLKWIIASIAAIIAPPAVMTFLINGVDNPFALIPAKLQLMSIIIWYLLVLLLTFESFLIWYFNVYIITNKRVIDVDFIGFWGKRISEASLDNVEDATYQTTKLLHILFDYGNIFMQTAAEQREFEFHSIPKPGLVHDKLTDLVEQFKNNNNR